MSTKTPDQLALGDCITYWDGYNGGRRRSMRVDGIAYLHGYTRIHGAVTTNANPKTPSLTKRGTEIWATTQLFEGDTVEVW